MQADFVSLEGKSRGYKIALAALGVFAAGGLASFVISYIAGHQTFGGTNTVPWGLPIVMAIYLIGLSAGLHILAFLIYIMKQEQYQEIIRLAVFLAIVLIFGAMLFIALDLGRPEKFWRLFMLFYMNNMTSMFAINSIFYSSYLVSAIIYLTALMSKKKRFSMVMGMVAFALAMLTHGGTGAIFGFISARETWFSSLSPFEFIFAALASSLALLIIIIFVMYRLTGRSLSQELVASLGGLVKGLLLGLLLLMAVGKLTHIYSPARDATMYMLGGPFSWLFWVFVIGIGAVVPLVLLFHPRTKGNIRWVVAASVLIVVGVFFKRYYLVIPGAAYPQHYYSPGTIEGVWGSIGSFRLMPVETFLSIGILAILGLVYIQGLKYMELLPAKHGPEPAPEKPPEGPEPEKPPEGPAPEEAPEEKEKPKEEAPKEEAPGDEEKPGERPKTRVVRRKVRRVK